MFINIQLIEKKIFDVIIVIDACKYLDSDEDCLYLMHHVNSNAGFMSASLQNKINILLSKEKCIWS